MQKVCKIRCSRWGRCQTSWGTFLELEAESLADLERANFFFFLEGGMHRLASKFFLYQI